MLKIQFSLLFLCFISANVSCYFGTELYAESGLYAEKVKVRLCEKVGIDQEDPALFLVALTGTDIYDQNYLRIE